nr:hypothetical protein [Leucobacter insecticola]
MPAAQSTRETGKTEVELTLPGIALTFTDALSRDIGQECQVGVSVRGPDVIDSGDLSPRFGDDLNRGRTRFRLNFPNEY